MGGQSNRATNTKLTRIMDCHINRVRMLPAGGNYDVDPSYSRGGAGNQDVVLVEPQVSSLRTGTGDARRDSADGRDVALPSPLQSTVR
jgi:hypothetical protein